MDVTSLLPWITGLAAIFLAGKLLQVLTMNTALAKMVDKVPGPATIPILGNAWSLLVPHEGRSSSMTLDGDPVICNSMLVLEALFPIPDLVIPSYT